jgi:hypothetical protein
VVASAPSSLGALPIGRAQNGELLVPLADDEAFWIGLTRCDPSIEVSLALRVDIDGHRGVDAFTGETWNAREPFAVLVPPVREIDGIRRTDDSRWVFARASGAVSAPKCRALGFAALSGRPAPNDISDFLGQRAPNQIGAAATVRLVDRAEFQHRTHLAPPSPLDPNMGYKGWRLP